MLPVGVDWAEWGFGWLWLSGWFRFGDGFGEIWGSGRSWFCVVSQIQFFAQTEERFHGAVVHAALADFVEQHQA